MVYGIIIIHICRMMCQMILDEEGDEDSLYTKLINSSLEKVKIK